MANFTISPSTSHSGLCPANPALPSLAYLPLEIVMLFLDEVFSRPQIITIDITGPINDEPEEWDMEGAISAATRIVMRAPPLNITAANACRLFREWYQRSRPTVWGGQLHSAVGYHVDPARDIFYTRIRRRVDYTEWDRRGRPDLDPLGGMLGGVERLATSPGYIWVGHNDWAVSFLRHLNPQLKELMILFPGKGQDDGGAERRGTGQPVVRPVKDSEMVTVRVGPMGALVRWEVVRDVVADLMKGLRNENPPNQAYQAIWAETWRASPMQEIRGYLVDSRDLNDPTATGDEDEDVDMEDAEDEE
ncbi:hypothetical protein VTK26DRAFT_1759 [Humicola hyalothermophila]